MRRAQPAGGRAIRLAALPAVSSAAQRRGLPDRTARGRRFCRRPAWSRASRRRDQAGALVLAHSWDGRLPQTQAEARIVQRLFGGAVYSRTTRRGAPRCDAAPTQILHIAAHGEHRLDQPDLSYIQLADGQLYTDDLLQHDLSYELVTLSACETGRANVAAGDELIGLGRGFLYAGAGALMVSLWRVADACGCTIDGAMYRRPARRRIKGRGAARGAARGVARRTATAPGILGCVSARRRCWATFEAYRT